MFVRVRVARWGSVVMLLMCFGCGACPFRGWFGITQTLNCKCATCRGTLIESSSGGVKQTSPMHLDGFSGPELGGTTSKCLVRPPRQSTQLPLFSLRNLSCWFEGGTSVVHMNMDIRSPCIRSHRHRTARMSEAALPLAARALISKALPHAADRWDFGCALLQRVAVGAGPADTTCRNLAVISHWLGWVGLDPADITSMFCSPCRRRIFAAPLAARKSYNHGVAKVPRGTPRVPRGIWGPRHIRPTPTRPIK
jgi:hypothetical protein